MTICDRCSTDAVYRLEEAQFHLHVAHKHRGSCSDFKVYNRRYDLCTKCTEELGKWIADFKHEDVFDKKPPSGRKGFYRPKGRLDA